MLLSPDGKASFTAHNGDVYYVRRGTAKAGLLAQAAVGRPIRGREQVRYSSGNRGREMFADAATENGRTVAVLVTDSPSWGGFTAGDKQGPEGNSGYCGNCAYEFTTFACICADCEQPPCPTCGRCECETSTGTAKERKCKRCYLLLPLPHIRQESPQPAQNVPEKKSLISGLSALTSTLSMRTRLS